VQQESNTNGKCTISVKWITLTCLCQNLTPPYAPYALTDFHHILYLLISCALLLCRAVGWLYVFIFSIQSTVLLCDMWCARSWHSVNGQQWSQLKRQSVFHLSSSHTVAWWQAHDIWPSVSRHSSTQSHWLSRDRRWWSATRRHQNTQSIRSIEHCHSLIALL